MANATTGAAPQEIGGGYQQFQDRLERQRQQYATRWLYSPLIRTPVAAFPGLEIPGGCITPLSGEFLAKHYGLKEIEKEVVENSGGLIQLTDNGRNYFHYVPPAQVAANIVMENAMMGVIELPELTGLPATKRDQINQTLFGTEFESATARIKRLQECIARNADKGEEIALTANRCIVATREVYRIALNTVRKARARLATPGNEIGLDDYELMCFDFTGEPLSETERLNMLQAQQPAPAPAPAPVPQPESPVIAQLLEQNQSMQAQLLAIQAESAKTTSRIVEILDAMTTPAASAKDEAPAATTSTTSNTPKRK